MTVTAAHRHRRADRLVLGSFFPASTFIAQHTPTALGPEHPDVAKSLHNLAGLYKAQGRYAEAESLYKRALAIFEHALGPEHPHVAASLENYAALLRETARADEAERMEARAKAIRAKSE